MSPEMAADWEVFKENFKKRFVPPEYIDLKKQEFTQLKQKNMSAHEYYRKFTDLSRYDPDTAGNQAEMLRRFKLGTKRKWQTFANALPCTTYHDFFEILVRMEDSDNLPSNSEEMRIRMIIRRKIIGVKVSPLRDPVRHRISRKMERARVLPAEDLVSQVRGEVEGLLVDPGFKDRETFVVLVGLVLRYATVVISDIMESVGKVVVLATLVDRWDIRMLSVPRVSRDLSCLLCHL
ncbi:hypothetical protein FF2_026245 [Malus domestica]